MTSTYIGNPPNQIVKWIKSHSGPTRLFDKIVKALETGNITNGVLNGVSVEGQPVAIGSQIESDIAYYQDSENILTKNSSGAGQKWTVCGFDGSVPEYVKYKGTDGAYYFVRPWTIDSYSTTYSTFNSVSNGADVFSRTWNSSTLTYDYKRCGTIKSVSSECFTYCNDSINCGTVVNTSPTVYVKTPSVPLTINISLADGNTIESNFVGHNMQLYSSSLLVDCDCETSLEGAKTMMSDKRVFTTINYGQKQFSDLFPYGTWGESDIRAFLNGTSKPTMFKMFEEIYCEKSYTAQHTFIDKCAVAENGFLENVCSQAYPVTNYCMSFQEDPQFEANDVSYVFDRFWIPDSTILRTITNNSSTYGKYFNCNGFCEIPQFSKSVPTMYSNGSRGSADGVQWVSNELMPERKSGEVYNKVGVLTNNELFYDDINVTITGTSQLNGIAPACTIG